MKKNVADFLKMLGIIIVSWWIGIILFITIHEGAHAFAAHSINFPIKKMYIGNEEWLAIRAPIIRTLYFNPFSILTAFSHPLTPQGFGHVVIQYPGDASTGKLLLISVAGIIATSVVTSILFLLVLCCKKAKNNALLTVCISIFAVFFVMTILSLVPSPDSDVEKIIKLLTV